MKTLLTLIVFVALSVKAADKPNVLWVIAEDMNDWMGCYGHAQIKTPHFDAMAADGVRFTRFYVTAPVCSSSRSGLILGAMQTTYGVHNHRSSRSRKKPSDDQQTPIHLPPGVKPVTRLLQDAGYNTCIQGKTDFNFVVDKKDLSNVKDWIQTPADKPWFAQIQLKGGKGGNRVLKNKKVISPDWIKVPPYYPDHPVFRSMLAGHYACVAGTDQSVGEVLADLRQRGQLENTIVFFLSDHGMPGGLRHKQFCYEGGIRVPLIIRWPKNFPMTKKGLVRNDLVSGADLAVTTLALAGVEIPDFMEGRDLFAKDFEPRDHVISARDRCDFTIDRIRAVVTKRYKYVRNFMPDRPWLQPQYRDDHPTMKTWKQLHADGKLSPAAAIFVGDHRPVEEFYDLEGDPHEIRNLAKDPAHAAEVKRHRKLLEDWIKRTDDKGQYPESTETLAYLIRGHGDKCVNPEYKPVREAMHLSEQGNRDGSQPKQKPLK